MLPHAHRHASHDRFPADATTDIGLWNGRPSEGSGWILPAWSPPSYSRYVDFFKRSHKITIQRLRCPECGSTHAVLIEDMIPYSIASYDLIVDVLTGIDFLVSSHAAYFKDKYLTYPFDYDSFCEMNTRKNHLYFFCFFT